MFRIGGVGLSKIGPLSLEVDFMGGKLVQVSTAEDKIYAWWRPLEPY